MLPVVWGKALHFVIERMQAFVKAAEKEAGNDMTSGGGLNP